MADFHIAFTIATFAVKKDMFNLNGSKRIVMAQQPTDGYSNT